MVVVECAVFLCFSGYVPVRVEVCQQCVSVTVGMIAVMVTVTVVARTESVSCEVGVGLVPLPLFHFCVGGDADVCPCVVMKWTFPELILTLS